MHAVDQKSERLLMAIQNGVAPFKYIPTEIGSLIFCYTDNENAEPYNKNQKIRKLIFEVLFPLVTIAACWLIIRPSDSLNESRCMAINIFISLVCVLFIIGSIPAILKFKGTDYFIGDKGFAVLKFENSRRNIVSESIHLYSDIHEIYTKENRVYQKGVYKKWVFRFWGKPDIYNCVTPILEMDGIHYQRNPEDDPRSPLYSFCKKIEELWTEQKLRQLLAQGNNTVSFSFLNPVKKDNRWQANPYLTITPTTIFINDRQFSRADIKSINIHKDRLIIWGANHSKKLLGLIETRDKEEINLYETGNALLLTRYLSYIVNTPELHTRHAYAPPPFVK